MNKTKTILGICLAALVPGLQAQTGTDSQGKHFQIPRTEQRPQIDGRISADEWANAIMIDELHQIRPREFSQPAKRTQFYFMYDEDTLYIAARIYDNPADITNNVMRHGRSMGREDRIHIALDPFNNKRSGYHFQTNPNGVRHEAIYTSANSLSFDWTTIWDTASVLLEDGWSAEMAIPFKSLTFDPGNDTWGINFWRSQIRDNTAMGWYSRNGQTDVANAGTMGGLTGLNQGIGLDVIPSFSATQTDNRIRGNNTDLNPSLDLTYKLTPSLNLTATWNTDFAATEVDAIQLDVGRFSPRFPEKRSFFLTDTDIFNFASDDSADPFHSRTIGLSSTGEPVDLVGGAKLSGRVGNYDIGLLVIRQDDYQAVDASELIVGRVKRGVLTESEMGIIYSYGDPASNDSSSTLGADFIYRNTRLPNNRSLTSTFWIQKTDNTGLDGDDLAWSADIDLPSSDSWFAGATIQEIQENYDPRLGFKSRTGVRQYALNGGRHWVLNGHPWIQKYTTSANFSQYDRLDGGDLQSREAKWEFVALELRSGDTFNAQVTRSWESLLPGERAPLSRLGIVIPPDEYSFNEYAMSFSTTVARPWDADMRMTYGDYYTGKSWSASPGVGWRPNRHLSFGLDYAITKYDMPDGTVFTRVVRFDNEIAFNTNLSLVNIIQYENVSNSLGFNSRLRWSLAAGQDIWFVLSHGMIDEDRDGNFTRTETSATAKIRYTLRF